MNDCFECLFKSRIGLDVSLVGSVVIECVVCQCMSGFVLYDEDEYWMCLNGLLGEVQVLIEVVVVLEIWFFCYLELFIIFVRLVFECLLSLGGGCVLRIFSLFCFIGEELYFIVMVLFDVGFFEYLFEVDVFDVSVWVIECVSFGVYGRNFFCGDELGFCDCYFSEVVEGYQLVEQVCCKVCFCCGNLFDFGLLVGEVFYDFVFCCNLLIYFDCLIQSEVVEVFKCLLWLDGVMFIGLVEVSLFSQYGMQLIGVLLFFVFCWISEVFCGVWFKVVSDGVCLVVVVVVECVSIWFLLLLLVKLCQWLFSLVLLVSGQFFVSFVGEFDEIVCLVDVGQYCEVCVVCEC